MTPRLSTIVPLYNRSGVRLLNCLRSLRWQQLEAGEHEIVISDFSNDPGHRRSIDELAAQMEARVVRTPDPGAWSKSRALNLGIQASRGEYLLCTDVDMIFQENFVPTLLTAHRSGSRESMLHCQCFDLPEELQDHECTGAEYAELRSRASQRTTLATGACQSAPREFFFRVRGYDEQFKHWGYEDLDMTWRAGRAGLEIRWVSDHTSMLHQWHPGLRQARPLHRWANCWRYRLTRHIVVKNRSGWGQAR